MHPIYLDNSATTPLLPPVWEAMQPFACGAFGNAASAHARGREARKALEDAREKIAGFLDAHADEVLFTSGATEANNTAIFGLAGTPPAQIVTGPIEHPSVAEPIAQLARRGFSIATLVVDSRGVIDPNSSPTAAGDPTPARLCCVQLVNHETGARQPIAALAQLAGSQVYFHTDAAAAAGKVPLRFHALNVTSLSLSAHKFHGPAGIGALLLRRGTSLAPLLFGGHQQQGRRPGTEPVALAVGMARALEIAVEQQQSTLDHVQKLRERFLEILHASCAPVVVNGPECAPAEVLPHTLNVSFPGCRADALLMNLDLAGIACSTGSACSSGSLLPSPVLQAMHVAEEVLRSAMRFSFSHLLSEHEIEEAARRIADVVGGLRGLPFERPDT